MNRQMIAMLAAGTCLAAGTVSAASPSTIGPEAGQPTEMTQVNAAENTNTPGTDHTQTTLTVTVGPSTRWADATWSDGKTLGDVQKLSKIDVLTVTGTGGKATMMEAFPETFPYVGKLILENVVLKFNRQVDANSNDSNNPPNKIKTIVIGKGATLDTNGKRVACEIDLAGGTLTNTANGNYNYSLSQLYDVSLSADSEWAVQKDSNMASIANGYDSHWIKLNGHTLTKTGAGTLDLRDGWLDGGKAQDGKTNGTLYVKEGTVSQIREHGDDSAKRKDPQIKNLTLHIGNGSFNDESNCWTRLSGDIVVDVDKGKTFTAHNNWAHLSDEGTGRVTSFVKRGNGEFRLEKCWVKPEKQHRMYTCATVIEAGTMIFGWHEETTTSKIPGDVTVESGATIGTCGNREVIIPNLTLKDGVKLNVSYGALLTVDGSLTAGTTDISLGGLPTGPNSVPLVKTNTKGLKFSLANNYRQTYKNGIYYAVKNIWADNAKNLSFTVTVGKNVPLENAAWSYEKGKIPASDVLCLDEIQALTVMPGKSVKTTAVLPVDFPSVGTLTFGNIGLKLDKAMGTGKIVIGKGATLDTNGKRVTSAIDLAGGTLTNTAKGNYTYSLSQLYSVSLSADSEWAVQEGSDMASIADKSAFHWIKLNGHMLTKTGAGALALRAGSLDGGTIQDGKGGEKHGTLYVREGTVYQMSLDKGDPQIKNLTLHIGNGTFIDESKCWTRLSGAIVVDVDEGKTFETRNNWAHLSNKDKVTSFVKQGKGVFCLQYCLMRKEGQKDYVNHRTYDCETVIAAGTMKFGANKIDKNRELSKIPGKVTVKSGATIGTCGNGEAIIPNLSLEDGAAVDVTGTHCVAADWLTLGTSLTVKLPTPTPKLPLRVVRTGAEGTLPTVTVAGLSDVFVRYMKRGNDNGLWLCEVSVDAVEGADPTVQAVVQALPPTLKQVLRHAAFAAGKESITVNQVTGTTGGQPIASEKMSDVLQCFDGEALGTLDETGTLSVAYDFGIDAMTCTDADTVQVTAKVRASENKPLTYAPGVSVKLLADGTELTNAKSVSVENGRAVFDVPLTDLIGKKLTVKAVKTP